MTSDHFGMLMRIGFGARIRPFTWGWRPPRITKCYVMHARQPQGYAQSLGYHPDVRRHVAKMSVDLEAARLITYHSAWLSDTQGPTPETTAALYRAKYVVGEAVSRITRTALTLGGAHGIFKGSRLEQLFRDGALAPLQPPPADFCLWNMSIFELGLDPMDMLPPLRPI